MVQNGTAHHEKQVAVKNSNKQLHFIAVYAKIPFAVYMEI
jgi:hypothetical protein